MKQERIKGFLHTLTYHHQFLYESAPDVMKGALFVAVVLMAVTLSSAAQVSSSATASAVIVTPVNIVIVGEVNFRNIGTAMSSGTVQISPAGIRSSTAGASLPVTSTVTAAAFRITGEPAYTFAITIPSGTHTITNGSNTMVIDNFSGSLSSPGTLTGGTPGIQTLTVDARLIVGPAQSSGTYISATPFYITVHYN